MPATRRDLLALAARAALLPGAAQFLAAWSHGGMAAPPEPPLLRDYRPQFFDARDFEALRAFTEILIPTDDTPGAREAHCAHYIDFLLHAADGVPALQAQWREAMRNLREMGFDDAGARARLVETMAAAEHPVYRLIKQLNMFAFYTSRAGMIDTLDYRGNTFNATFPACTHPEHREI